MKHGVTRAEAPLPSLSLNWRAPSTQGGGGPEVEAGKATAATELLTTALHGAILQMATLVLLLDRMEPEVPEGARASDADWIRVKQGALEWLGEWGEKFKASGLTAEHELTRFAPALLRERKAESSGLTAEGIETDASSTTPLEDAAAGDEDGPVDGKFAAMLAQLGRRPA